jgi:hypothetical protein
MSPLARWVRNATSRRPWYRLGRLGGLAALYGIREELRAENLHDTGSVATAGEPEPSDGPRDLNARQPDGAFTTVEEPMMGAQGTRYGRNASLHKVRPDEDSILVPDPRRVSLELMARDTFTPATILNVLAAAWIQFQVHDWTNHGKNEPPEDVEPYEVAKQKDDPWPREGPITILHSRRDPTPDATGELPPTFRNRVTHWWDASQVYGSGAAQVARGRSGVDGKLKTDSDGDPTMLPLDPEVKFDIDLTGVNENYWVGLSVLHTLFAKEHNAVCDMLKLHNPTWSDDQLFDKARLITSALIAKIHTVEWTPAILPTQVLHDAMFADWYGLFDGRLEGLLGFTHSDMITGAPGSNTDQFDVPFAITEEFVAVYRLHSLIPDDWKFRSMTDGAVVAERSFEEIAGRHVRPLISELGWNDVIYTLGTDYPGAITMHNFPRTLQQFELENGAMIDLAATDLVRDRERGVPRYNDFREMLHLDRVRSFEELTGADLPGAESFRKEWAEQIREVYDGEIDMVDTQIGLLAEPFPPGFGFSDTAFRIFVLMAPRRLKSDRFLSIDFTPEVYTPEGIDWVRRNTMVSVLLRHHTELEPVLRNVGNAFAPWPRVDE